MKVSRPRACFVCSAVFEARSRRHVLCGKRDCRKERRRWRDRLPEPEDPALVLAFENGRTARRSCLELSSNPFRDDDPSSQGSIFHGLMRRYWRAGWRAELSEQLRSAGLAVAPRLGPVLRSR